MLTKKFVWLDEFFILWVSLLNYRRYNIFKCCSIDKPENTWSRSSNWSWSWFWIKQSKLAKPKSYLNLPYLLFVTLNNHLPFLQYKERACWIILFHEIFSWTNFTHLKFVNKLFMNCLILYQRRESKMLTQTFCNKLTILLGLFNLNRSEFFIYFFTVSLSSDSSKSFRLPFFLYYIIDYLLGNNNIFLTFRKVILITSQLHW